MNIRKIDSRDNDRIKLARRIRDGKEKGLIFVEGTRLAEEVLNSDVKIEFCLFENGYQNDSRGALLIESTTQKTNDVFEINHKLFASVSDTSSSQGVILICRRPGRGRFKFELEVAVRTTAVPLVMMLIEINNPSNLGAVIRAADAADIAGVIVSKRSADVFSPKALRGSMGSSLRIPVWEGAEFTDVFDWASAHGFLKVGATVAGGISYSNVAWASPHLLIMGSEAHGLPVEIEKELDDTIRIPMKKEVESLNLAVAAGVILFEARRQVSAQLKTNGSPPG